MTTRSQLNPEDFIYIRTTRMMKEEERCIACGNYCRSDRTETMSRISGKVVSFHLRCFIQMTQGQDPEPTFEPQRETDDVETFLETFLNFSTRFESETMAGGHYRYWTDSDGRQWMISSYRKQAVSSANWFAVTTTLDESGTATWAKGWTFRRGPFASEYEALATIARGYIVHHVANDDS